jgi:hypothetical protein
MSAINFATDRVPSEGAIETLSELALNAAIELDRIIRGAGRELKAVSELVEELGSAQLPQNNEGRHSLTTDPNKMVVLTKAVGTSTIQETSDRVAELIGSFKGYEQSGEVRKLADLYEFCLALHRELLPRRRPSKHDWWIRPIAHDGK